MDGDSEVKTGSLKEDLVSSGYQEYSYRYVIMALFFGVSITNQMLWVTCSPITTNLTKIYGLEQLTINLSSLIAMIVYVPAAIPGNYLLDEYGTKKGLILGTALTLAGAWVRIFAGDGFTWVLMGQLLAAIGQPLILNCPQKVSAFWTFPQHRTIFTTLLTLAAPLGVAVGFLLPGAIVGDETSSTEGKSLFVQLLFIEAIISTVLCVPLFIFLREKPPTPPSPSAEMPRENFKSGMKSIFKNKGFLALLVVEAVGLGTFNSLATVIQTLIDPFGYSQLDASVLGAIIIVFGLFGSIAMGLYVEKTRKYKKAIIICILTSLIAFALFSGMLYSKSLTLLAVGTAFLGFFMTPILPLGLEFACEITFPVGEAVSGGAMIGMSQFVGAIQIVVIDSIMTVDDQKSGTLITIVMYVVLMAFAFVCSLMVKENLLRTKHDRSHSRNNSVHDVTNEEPSYTVHHSK